MVRLGRGFPIQTRLLSLLRFAQVGAVLTIDGVEVMFQRDSMRITETLNGRGTMTCDIVSMDGSYRPQLNKEVTLTFDGVRMFAGNTAEAPEQGHRTVSGPQILTRIACTDFNELPSRRQVALTLAAGTLKSMLQTIKGQLEDYNVTLDPAQANGDTLHEIVFEEGPLDAVLDKLATITGWYWEIDYNRVLRMKAPGTDVAPFAITDGDRYVLGDLTVDPSLADYANWVKVWYTELAAEAYGYFEMDAIPTDGEWTKVGSQTYTFKDSPVGGNDVQIAATVADTLDNLIAAISPAHAEVEASSQAADMVVVGALAAGASGNSIQVDSNCADARWITEGGGGISHLAFGTDDALTGFVIAEDVGEQNGGANLREKVYKESTITDETTAQAFADGKLARHLVITREAVYTTRETTVHPGMQQAIAKTERNIDADCLVTGVEIFAVGHRKLRSRVTAVEGLVIPPSDLDMFREWTGHGRGTAA